jgi:hypothetical protein
MPHMVAPVNGINKRFHSRRSTPGGDPLYYLISIDQNECDNYVQKSMFRPGTIMIDCTSGQGVTLPHYAATRARMFG